MADRSQAVAVLDAHVHLWDTAELSYPLFEGVRALQGAHLVDDYTRAAEPLGIERAICVEAASAGAGQGSVPEIENAAR